MQIAIRQTWDGHPVPLREHVFIDLLVNPDAGLSLRVDAPFHGDPPPPTDPGPTWELWRHEVVELFVSGPDQRYTEIELSPWGHHLVLQLEGRRHIVARELPLDFQATIEGGRWTGRARLAARLLPPGPHRVNAYAVHGSGARRHLAWQAVPGSQPDFHRRDRFVLV